MLRALCLLLALPAAALIAQDAKQAEFLRLLNLLRSDPYTYAEQWWGFPRAEMEAFMACPDASLPPVHWNHRLAVAVARQVEWCAKTGVLSHYQPEDQEHTVLERLAASGIKAPASGGWYPQEILLVTHDSLDGTSPDDPRRWLALWFESASHRLTLLDAEIDHVGLAMVAEPDTDGNGILDTVRAGMIALQTSVRPVHVATFGIYNGPRFTLTTNVPSFWDLPEAKQWQLNTLGSTVVPANQHTDRPHWLWHPNLGWLWVWQQAWLWEPDARMSGVSTILGQPFPEVCNGVYRANWGDRLLMPDHVAQGLPEPDPSMRWIYLATARQPLAQGWHFAGGTGWLWHAETNAWRALQPSPGPRGGLHVYAPETGSWATLVGPLAP